MKKRAFTLIELLVVISIIAVLASIALPVFRSVQEKAHGVQDLNNLKQIGLGFVSYLNDHDDTMFSSAGLGGSTWGLALSGSNGNSSTNYVPDMRMFQSPFDNTNPRNNALSYGINTYIFDNPPVAGGVTLTSVTAYTHPSSLIVLGPHVTYANNKLNFDGTTATNVTVTPGAVPGVMNSRQILNVLFCDWHVSSMKASDFNVVTSSTNTMWNPVAQTNQ